MTSSVNRRRRSPSIIRRRRTQTGKQGRLRRWKRAVGNWLNGLPVAEVDDFDADGQDTNNISNNESELERRRKKNEKRERIKEFWKPKHWLRRKSKKKEQGENIVSVPISGVTTNIDGIKNGDECEEKEEIVIAPPIIISTKPVRVIQLPPENNVYISVRANKKDDISSSTVTNEIRTAKYTLFNFLPKNILEQMRRVANIYFVIIVMLQCFPAVSNYSPLLAAMPIIAIMAVTAIKDAVEDWRRHQQDIKVNYAIGLTLYRPYSQLDDVVNDNLWRRFMKKVANFGTRLYKKYNSSLAKIRGQECELKGKHRVLVPVVGEKVDWKETFWRDMRVGDIVVLRNNEMIPADVMILSTSEPDGMCFVETKNLDGETNLKIRRSPYETEWISTPLDAITLKATIEVDMPNPQIYSFNGKIIISKDIPSPILWNRASQVTEASEADSSGVGNLDPISEQDEEEESSSHEMSSMEKSDFMTQSAFIEPTVIPIKDDGILLRGCILRNTDYVIGVVVYTGPHTKLMLNSGITPSKRTRIERQMNPQIIINFILLFIICLSCAIVQAQFSSTYENAPYWVSAFQQNSKSSSAFLGFLTFWSSLILFQTLVPISMYVTVELVKTIQAYFINHDLAMYFPETDTRATPRAWNLADDLGQIKYLFSDKTGTLTQNVMEFRRCSIAGQVYGSLSTSAPAPSGLSRQSSSLQLDKMAQQSKVDNWTRQEEKMTNILQDLLTYPYIPPSKFSFVDTRLYQSIIQDVEQRERIFMFFLVIVVCHTVLVDIHSDPDGENPKESLEFKPHNLIFKAQSPDEAALVGAARDLGFVFLGRDKDKIFVSILGEVESITVLNVLEFTSSRKRMSTIVRRQDGQLLLMCKGADNVVFERLVKECADSEASRLTQNHLELFAEDGLRTLCVAQKTLDEDEYLQWVGKFSEALTSMDDRDNLVEAVCEEIESDLELLGVTAIEDRLQEGVPECIELLRNAGIKVWVLTGDKMETAINIGFSCKLLDKNMVLLVIRGADADETLKQLKSAYERIWSRFFCFGDNSADPAVTSDDAKFALIIDGSTLKYALDVKCRKLFVNLSSKCEAVICCRVSPLQKAKVVELIRKSKNAMTLAIGDGANDVSMIQAADVGVGIAGQEGMQAVMSSDYAIAQFRFLSRLLLVHGRWSYLRVAEVTLCSLYKNLAFVVLLYWYQFYCGFTAQYIYDYMYLLFFNVFFSILPLLLLGCFDRDLPDTALLRVPRIYELGIRQTSYSMKLFMLYMVDAIYQSLVCFFIPLMAYQNTAIRFNGQVENQTLVGNVMAISIITCTNLYMAINTYSWVLAIPLGLFITILTLFAFLLIYAMIPGQSLFGSWYNFIDPMFWATILLSLVVALAPRFIAKYVQSTARPTDLDIVREVEKYGINREDLDRSLRKETSVARFLGDESWKPGKTACITEPPKALLPLTPKKLLGVELADGLNSITNDVKSRPPVMEVKQNPNVKRSLGDRFLRSLSLFNLRTGSFERLRGFAFSQEDGMGEVITHQRRAEVNKSVASSKQMMTTLNPEKGKEKKIKKGGKE